jgi:hypothetical protein
VPNAIHLPFRSNRSIPELLTSPLGEHFETVKTGFVATSPLLPFMNEAGGATPFDAFASMSRLLPVVEAEFNCEFGDQFVIEFDFVSSKLPSICH